MKPLLHVVGTLSILAYTSTALGALCDDVFSNAVSTTGGDLVLANNADLTNTGDKVLATTNLVKSKNNNCDGADCIESGTAAPTLSMPPNSSTTDYNGSPLSFGAGDYYYDDFTLNSSQVLTVTSGTVRIHVGDAMEIGIGARVNDGGDHAELIFLVGNTVRIRNNARVEAIIYAVNSVQTDNGSRVTGSVTAHDVSVGNNSEVIYASVAGADFDGACSTGAGSVDADGFNCVVAGGDALNGHLYLQKVGTGFGFDLVALEDSDGNGSMDAVQDDFASDADRDVLVELVDTSGGAACAAQPALSPAMSQTLTFAAGDAGRKAAATMTVNKAYRSVGCRVTDSGADPEVETCSTDSFSIRPTALSLSPPALNNSGSSGAPNQAAGSHFTLSVSAGAGYDGTPQIDHTRLAAHAGAIQTGTLSGGFNPAVAGTGIATGAGFGYSEVGNFRFAAQGLYDAAYSSVDQPGDCTDDFSNTAVGGKYGCKFGNTSDSAWVGRFTPDHFTAAELDDGALANTCVAGGFSYQGEDIAFATDPSVRISARNAAAEVTQNYTGAYAKLSGASFSFAAVSGDGTALGVDGVTPVTLTWTVGALGLVDNLDGTHDLGLSGDRFVWGRTGNDRVAPFTTDLELNLSAISDDDSVAGSGLPELIEPAGVDMHYGRLALVNAHGSELQDLGVPMQVEHYQGAATGFVPNTADSCSNVTGILLTDLNVGDGLVPAETCVWDDPNVTGLGCAGPGPPAAQYGAAPLAGGFNLNLKAPGANNSGVLGISADAPAWLEFDWTGTGDSDPNARATFGIFNRATSIIYQRELR